jgi:hypothetical protein
MKHRSGTPVLEVRAEALYPPTINHFASDDGGSKRRRRAASEFGVDTVGAARCHPLAVAISRSRSRSRTYLLGFPAVIIPSHLSLLSIQSRILRNQTKLTDNVTYILHANLQPLANPPAKQQRNSRLAAAGQQPTNQPACWITSPRIAAARVRALPACAAQLDPLALPDGASRLHLPVHPVQLTTHTHTHHHACSTTPSSYYSPSRSLITVLIFVSPPGTAKVEVVVTTGV